MSGDTRSPWHNYVLGRNPYKYIGNLLTASSSAEQNNRDFLGGLPVLVAFDESWYVLPTRSSWTYLRPIRTYDMDQEIQVKLAEIPRSCQWLSWLLVTDMGRENSADQAPVGLQAGCRPTAEETRPMVILGCEPSLWYVSGPGRADKKPATTGESVCTRGPCSPSLYWCLWCALSLFIAAEITGLLSDDGSGLTRPFRLAYSADTSLISYDDMSTWQWCKNLMLTTLLMEIPACFREVLLRSRLRTSNTRCDLDTIIVEALFCFKIDIHCTNYDNPI